MTSNSAFLLTSIAFPHTRGIAIGIVTMFGSMGGLLYPLLVTLLVDKYSYQGTFLILGAIMSHFNVAAVLICGQTGNLDEVVININMEFKSEIDITKCNSTDYNNSINHCDNNARNGDISKKSTEETALIKRERSTLGKVFDLMCLTQYSIFSVLILTTFMFAYMAKVIHFATICAEKLHKGRGYYSSYDIMHLLIAMSFIDMIARPVSG